MTPPILEQLRRSVTWFTARRARLVALVTGGMEGLLLLLVVLSPWAFGAVHPYFEYYLYLGVAGLLALWGVKLVLEGRFTWEPSPVALCLAGLVLLGFVQLIAWPGALLGWLSPATADLFHQLLPAEPEVLRGGLVREPATLPAGSALSLYPAVTRSGIFRLLAVFLVFALVRNNLTSAGAFRRFSAVVVVNGALLALFGLVQSLTAGSRLLYWTFPAGGAGFGPFVCRNHFAFYLNICIGLAIGWLLLSGQDQRGSRSPSRARDDDTPWYQQPAQYLQKPLSLWIVCGLTLMIGAVALCLSRGGVLALLGGCVVCLLLRLSLARRQLRLERALLVATLVLAFLAWYGMEGIQRRWDPLWQDEAVREGRFSHWRMVLPLAGKFPLWGTGLGTYPYVEPLTRLPGEADLFWDHAHNDYLEALIEGGLVRLLLSLAAIGLVYRAGYRALRRYQGRSTGALVMGAIFAFTTVVIHSFVDFGLHIPAIALVITAIAAFLCNLGEPRPASAAPVAEQGDTEQPVTVAAQAPNALQLGSLAALGAAAALLTVGHAFVQEGWRASQADRFRLAAERLAARTGLAERARRVALLQEAVRWTPDNALLHQELAQLHLDHGEAGQRQRVVQDLQLDVATAVAQLQPGTTPAFGGLSPAFTLGVSWGWTRTARADIHTTASRAASDPHRQAALREFLLARDLCPLLGLPQVQLPGLLAEMGRGDSAAAYFRRARTVRPFDAEFWYLSGVQELVEGHTDSAWVAWRRSLTCSDRFLRDILRRSRAYLEPDGLVARVLPDDPALLLAAAAELEPASTSSDRQRPFLEKALQLLDEQSSLTAKDYSIKAGILRKLDRPQLAIAAYQAALSREPDQIDWRYALAEILHQEGQLREARNELVNILAQQASHGPAQTLLKRVTRGLLEQP